MSGRAHPLAELRPSRRQLATFGLYLASAALYIAIGVAVTDFLLSFWTAAAYVVLSTWLIPTLVRRVL